VRHVASQVDEDMVASGQRTAAGSTTRRQKSSEPRRRIDVAEARSLQTRRRRRLGSPWGSARAGKRECGGSGRRIYSAAAAKLHGGGTGAEMGGREVAGANEYS
jgi:hypothetical protein